MRVRMLIKLFIPFFLLYLIYFLILEHHIFKNADLFSIRAQETFKLGFEKLDDKKIDYLILGDSSALYAINPMELSNQSFSKATIASSLYMAEKQLREIDVSKINKAIIISQTFIDDHYDMDIWGLLVPNGIMNFSDVNHLLNSSGRSWEDTKLATQYVMAKLHLTKHAASSLMKRFKKPQFDFEKYRTYLRHQLLISRGHLSEDPIRNMTSEYFKMPYELNFKRATSPPPQEIASLKAIIQIAEQNNLKVYFVKTPMATSHLNVNSDIYENSVNKLLEPIKSSNFTVINGWEYGQNLKFDNFLDFNHLNRDGAKKFTRFVQQKL